MASTTTLALRGAMEARDLDAVVAAFAPDAVFRSPFTARLRFEGPEQIAAICAVILDAFHDFRYTDEVRSGDLAFLEWTAEIGGQQINGVDRLRLNSDGLVEEFVVFMRPLPATAAALRVIGTHLGRRKSRPMGAVISTLTAPVALLTRAGDPIGVRLIRSTL